MICHIDRSGSPIFREFTLVHMLVLSKLTWYRWYGMICCYVLAFLSGFGVFVSGQWDTASFFSNYLSIGIYVGCFLGWKVVKRTSVSHSSSASFIHERVSEFITHLNLSLSISWTCSENLGFWKLTSAPQVLKLLLVRVFCTTAANNLPRCCYAVTASRDSDAHFHLDQDFG